MSIIAFFSIVFYVRKLGQRSEGFDARWIGEHDVDERIVVDERRRFQLRHFECVGRWIAGEQQVGRLWPPEEEGPRLSARFAGRGDEGRHAVCAVERADDCGLAGAVGGHAGLVCGRVPGKCQVRRHYERAQRHGNSARDRHQQSAASPEAPIGHPGNGFADFAVGTADNANNTRFR